MVSENFDDMRPYMPQLSFMREDQLDLNNYRTTDVIKGSLVTDSSEIPSAFKKLEKRRSKIIANLNEKLDQPFLEKKRKNKIK